MYRQRVLRAHVDNTFGGARHISADDHAFQQGVRVAFNLVAVHVGAGVPFIRVADEVLPVARGLAQEFPFETRQESGAAAAAQPRRLDLLDHHFRVGVDEHFVQRLIPADADVLFDVVRADQAAIAQYDLLLRFEEGHFLP